MNAHHRTEIAAFLAVAGYALSVGVAGAQTIGDEAKCRATIAKVQTKLTATVGKNQRGCTKNVLKGKLTLASGEKCHQNSTSDVKQKAQKAAGKLQASIDGGAKSKCLDGTHTITLAGLQPNCMVGVGGVPLAISSFADVADCQESAAIGAAELVFGEIVNPDYEAILASTEKKGLSKCVDAIAKNAIKAIATTGKARSKAQNGSDKNSGDASPSYSQLGVSDSKIDKAINKMTASITKACVDSSKAPFTTENLIHLGSCSAESVSAINACVTEAVEDMAEGVVSMAYLSSGEFPAATGVAINSGTASSGGSTASGGTPLGFRNRTRLDTGFTGLSHNVDIIDGFEGEVSLSCGGDGICDISASCAKGNCRCAAPNNDIKCDEPFGPDADDCASADCELLFGPLLALNASSTPICVKNIIDGLSGTVDLSNGNSTSLVQNRSIVYLDEGGQAQPCPLCAGDTTPDDGVKDGTCEGGPDDGDPCDENGNHPTFGPTSYDCDPTGGKNVSGTGLDLKLNISDEPATLSATVSCGGALGSLDCHCRVCTGSGNIPCNTDSDCPGGDTCTTNGAGVSQVQPNACSSDVFVCEADGRCATTGVSFCDGFLRASGAGILTCATNGDCVALNTACPGGDCGNCALIENVPCFGTNIVANDLTNSGGNHAVLGTTFCIPPTANGGVNAAAGFPGPGRLIFDFDFDIKCDDGVTDYVYGGIACP